MSPEICSCATGWTGAKCQQGMDGVQNCVCHLIQNGGGTVHNVCLFMCLYVTKVKPLDAFSSLIYPLK